MERAGWARREGAQGPGWLIYPGFMVGPALCRVRGLEVQQLRLLPLTQLVLSQGLSFHTCPALAFGVCAGDWGLGSSKVAPLCLDGKWSLGPRPRCLPGLKRHSLPPAPSGLKPTPRAFSRTSRPRLFIPCLR